MLVQPPHARKGERAAIFWAGKQHKHRNKQEKKLEDGLDMHPQYWWGECCEIQTGQSQTETCFTQTAEVIDDKYSFIDELLFP
jgi:hypothetical protein